METELANLHLTNSNKLGRTTSNVSMNRRRSTLSRTNSYAAVIPPPSPTVSEHSLIFERSVEDLTTLPSTFQSSSTNLNQLFSKHRSNSNVLLQKDLTGGSMNSVSSTHSIAPIAISRSQSRNSMSHSMLFNSSYLPQQSQQQQISPPNHSHHHHSRRRTIENMVAPALDASCSVIADDSTRLNEVNLIHSRCSSTIGLDMALGISRSSSISTAGRRRDDDDFDTDTDFESSNFISKTNSNTLTENTTTTTSPNSLMNLTPNDPPKVLKFYSYVDMVSDEQINPAILSRRPSFLTTSLSSPLLRPSELLNSPNNSASPTPQLGINFLKPSPSSIKRDQSPYISPPLGSRRFSNNNNTNSVLLSRSPTYSNNKSSSKKDTNNNNKLNKNKKATKGTTKFHIDSSDEFSSDDDNDLFGMERPSSSNNNSNIINSDSPLQNSKMIPSILKSTTSTDYNNMESIRSRTYSSSSINCPLERKNTANSQLLKNISIPCNGTGPGSMPPMFKLHEENLGDILRQKVSDSNPTSRCSTPISKTP